MVAGEGRHTSSGSASRRRVEQNPLDQALDQAEPSTSTETTAVEPPVLDKTKKRYLVVIPYVKGISEQVRRVIK